MAYRNKTYVCFDGDTDIHYFWLMKAWHQNDRSVFEFIDAHDLNTARDSSQEQSIKRQLLVRLSNTKVFVVLVGSNTRYLTKFVRWEMEQALSLRLPIIAVNLNGMRHEDNERLPPVIRSALTMNISFNAAIMQYALEHWPDQHLREGSVGKSGPFHYGPSIYTRLGL